MAYSEILLEVADGVALVTLNLRRRAAAALRVLRGGRRAVEAAETDLVHGHAQAAGVLHLEEGATAGDDREHAGHLEVHDAIADLDGLVAHGGGACRWPPAIARRRCVARGGPAQCGDAPRRAPLLRSGSAGRAHLRRLQADPTPPPLRSRARRRRSPGAATPPHRRRWTP